MKAKLVRLLGLLSVQVWAGLGIAAEGFDISNLSVPRSQVGSGGVPRDGIPSIDKPKFWTPEEAERYLFNGDLLLSFGEEGNATGYPLRILAWHEIVNDEVEGHPIAVTYCPLCGTGMVFSRVDETSTGRTMSLGVSGLLYMSDMLMYDRETESLWSQLEAEAISGPKVGTKLAWLPSSQMTWKAWKKKNPNGRVLSTDTGFDRPYNQMPYEGYLKSAFPLFKVPTARNDLPMKAWIVGIRKGSQTKAYRVAGLKSGEFDDDFDGEKIRISYDRSARFFRAWDEAGKSIPAVWCYWFAWQAFHPETVMVNKLR